MLLGQSFAQLLQEWTEAGGKLPARAAADVAEVSFPPDSRCMQPFASALQPSSKRPSHHACAAVGFEEAIHELSNGLIFGVNLEL